MIVSIASLVKFVMFLLLQNECSYMISIFISYIRLKSMKHTHSDTVI
jgi:hypothetical protein